MYAAQKALLGIAPRVKGLVFRLWILANGGRCGTKLHVHKAVWFKHPPHRGIRIGNEVMFGRGMTIDVPKGATLELGDRVAFTGYSFLSSSQEVIFHNDILIGEFTSVRDANHGTDRDSVIMGQPMRPMPILVESDVWLGRGVTLLRGATVRTGCVVGANALVNSELEPYGVYVGAPAKRIAERQ